MNRKRWLLIALMSSLLLLSCVNMWGQATATATLQGTVTDKSQAVIKSAEVTVTSKATGASRTINTNEAGEYRIDLAPGIYTIKAKAAGFSTAEAKDVEVLIGRTGTQNFTLLPGGVSETVEVTAAAPLVDQTKTDVSTNITPEQITDLPLIGRDIADLAYLAPGVKSADSYDPTKNRYAILSVNGQGGRNVNVTVNGVDNKDNTVGGPVMQLPAEAVQEFQISTQRFSAVNGRSAGAAINVITKSGSNNFHGSAFGFFRDEAFNADQKLPDPANNTTTSQGVPYSRQWFGGSIGGPLKKDKLFAFFSMERQREQTSLAESPTALAELNLAKAIGAQPAAVIPRPFYENRINGRMDWTINQHHSAYLSVSTQANDSLNDQSDGTMDLTEGNFTVNHLQVANLSFNSAFTPTLANQLTLGWQYWNNLIDSKTRTPLITFPDAQFGTNTNVPQNSIQRKWQFKDDISKIVGKHTFKTGIDYIWTPLMGGFFEFNPTLEIDFGQDPSCILATVSTATCGPANFPQGFATPGAVSGNNTGGGMSIAVGDPTFIIKDAKQLGLYFQDDWKFSPRLTVNLGLRYDKDFDFVGGSKITDSRTFQELQAAAPFSPLAASLVAKKATDYSKGFSPRIGLAYDLTGHGNQIFRAGFGMYYDNTFQNIPLFMEQQANNTIFQTAFAISGTDTVPGTAIPLSNWRFGIDPLPTIPAPSHNLTSGSTGRLMDPNYRTPVTEEWNAGYTWAINPKSVFEAEYVHVLGLHENKTINLDPNIPVTPNNITTLSRTGLPGGFFRPLDAAFTAAGVPLLGSVRDETAGGRSRYDGVNFSYRQRNFHKMDLMTNYTLSRSVGYDQVGGSFRYYPRDPQHPLAANEFGPAFNDERHHLTVAATGHLPYGLEVSPIMQVGSARPYLADAGTNQLNLGGGSSAAAMVVPNGQPTNFTAFNGNKLGAVQCYYSGNCQVVPYNSLRGNPYFNLDARVAKNLKMGEGRNLQLIFQAFNLTNHANYGNNFGTSSNDSTTFRKAIGFINPTSTYLPRSFQGEFGARFSF
ncbi:MAG TPA: carboxypeptidase regulatory-like domain-containing protein [Candidatus Angelobacter sp.]|nr:carboxypeptidase regulatory-like domain-containing protein [Candidatus Angelobacter sp.]